MLPDLTEHERVLIIVALRDLARRSDARADALRESAPRLAQCDRDDARAARSIIAKVRA